MASPDAALVEKPAIDCVKIPGLGYYVKDLFYLFVPQFRLGGGL